MLSVISTVGSHGCELYNTDYTDVVALMSELGFNGFEAYRRVNMDVHVRLQITANPSIPWITIPEVTNSVVLPQLCNFNS